MMIGKRVVLVLCMFIGFAVFVQAQAPFWLADQGVARINSDAPLELIQAESNSLRGIIDPSTNSFAFTIRVNSFEGFNSNIQQTHFLENYLEQKKFPQTTFRGKFIEDIPFETPGTYSVRAKGRLDIHGITRERIIRGTIVISKENITVHTRFLIPVADHGISIPKIVMQKIAEEIEVNIDIGFTERKTE